MLHPQLHSESHSYTQKNDFSCDKNRDSKPKANDITRAHARTPHTEWPKKCIHSLLINIFGTNLNEISISG